MYTEKFYKACTESDLIDKEEVSSIAKSKPKAQVESSDYAVTIVITDDPTHGSVLLISPHYLDADKTNCFGLAEFTFMTFGKYFVVASM